MSTLVSILVSILSSILSSVLVSDYISDHSEKYSLDTYRISDTNRYDILESVIHSTKVGGINVIIPTTNQF